MKNLYLQEKHPWGSNPNAVVKNFLTSFKKGTVLDLGSGDGRDVVFLSNNGFQVTAVDKYAEALVSLKDVPHVTSVCADIYEFLNINKEMFDNVISTWTLHFLERDRVEAIIEKMKLSTNSGGLNVISNFTQDGPFYKEGSTSFFAKSNELKQLYSDWDILHYEEKEVPTKVGSTQMAAFVVAKKP